MQESDGVMDEARKAYNKLHRHKGRAVAYGTFTTAGNTSFDPAFNPSAPTTGFNT